MPRPPSSERRRVDRAESGAADRAAPLSETLGHAFADAALLDEALSHSSLIRAGGRDNERLEFLGDRVLALLVTELLLERFPDVEEGDLAPRLNALVRGETCAAVAQAAGLQRHVRLGTSEEGSGGRRKPSILADVCEAVIGALYLDGGLDVARRFVRRHWEPRLAALAEAPRDAKTVLQEWTQGLGLGTPLYEMVGRSGPDHAPSFRVRASVPGGGHGAGAEGEGPSKRAAEQAAAAALLIAEKVWQQG